MPNGEAARAGRRETAPLTVPMRAPQAVVAHWRGRAVSAAEFCAHVQRLQARLPQRRFMLNLCDERYLFLVAFAAALAEGQISLLPPNRAGAVVEEILAAYPDSYRLGDAEVAAACGAGEGADASAPLPLPDPAAVACHIFTSGSTGTPRAHPKRWAELVEGSRLLQRRFGLQGGDGISLVVTVPPQHMYGLETSVLLPLLAPVTVHGGRPFFPEDVRRALAAVDSPRVLITTPVHLRACVEANLHWPALEYIVCATAPLVPELARRAEVGFGCPVHEIYGSTETGSVATRAPAQGAPWRLYDSLRLEPRGDGVYLHGPQVPEAVRLNDRIEPAAGGFRLLGRDDDLVNIAGKRGSIGDLTGRLLAIPGVQDGLFFLPRETDGRVERLCAFVVAPGMSSQAVQRALAEQTDPVFLPRPLCLVEALPRDETGKVPRRALEALLARHRAGHA